MTTARRPRTSRLSATDWTDGALDLLRIDGVAALGINRLCEHLGVTRGSFYWHFADLDALKEAVTERWCADTRSVLDSFARLDRLPPVERLRAMTLRLLDEDSASIERALRAWARTDERVAGVVAEADLAVFGSVQGALVDLGRGPEEARVLAGLLVYAGIGFAHGEAGLPRPTVAEVDRLLGLIV